MEMNALQASRTKEAEEKLRFMRINTPKEIKHIFKISDKNKDGTLSRDEFTWWHDAL